MLKATEIGLWVALIHVVWEQVTIVCSFLDLELGNRCHRSARLGGPVVVTDAVDDAACVSSLIVEPCPPHQRTFIGSQRLTLKSARRKFSRTSGVRPQRSRNWHPE